MYYKILYSHKYVERDLFVIDVDGKQTKVYRSSGFSGTGHGGMIFPFTKLKETLRRGLADYEIGYIYKTMLLGGREWYCGKNPPEFCDNMLNTLRNTLPILEESGEEYFKDIDVFKEYVKQVNDTMDSYIKEPFDWGVLRKEKENN